MSIEKLFLAMKNLRKSAVILVVLIVYSWATPSSASAQQGYVSTQVFYDQLSPYGQWIDNPNYGYIWIPDVAQDFSPYSTSGYWVMTEYGWTWVSDYPWGWAPFHYGRWDYDNYYGWFWVPDNEWGPSWVTWRRGNGYYGWTPMRPGMNINMSFGNDYHDIDHWYFVRERDFGQHDMHRYYADRRDYNTIIINSTVINNTYVDRSRNTTYIAGPSRNDVQRVTGRKVSNVAVRDYDRPGQKMNRSQMQIYRPQIQEKSDRGQKPAPSRITSREDVRPARERNRPDQQGKTAPAQNSNNGQQQSQPVQQTEKRNQEQGQQPQQQQEQRRQEQNHLERQNQQKQKQQINNQIQEQAKQQNRRSQQQAEKRNQEKQRQVQQQQERSNQVKQQKNQQRQVQQQKPSEQKQTRKTQGQPKQNSTNPSGNKGNEKQPNGSDSPEKQKRN